MDLPKFQTLHRDIFALDSPWAQHLEGSYLPRAALMDLPPPQREFWYLDNGARELIRSDHDDSLVVYWVLREKGITLAGSDIRGLVALVSTEALRAEILTTMRHWGPKFIAEPNIIGELWYQQFVVSFFCRGLHTLATGTVSSKPAGFAWAKDALDASWRHLIGRAEASRPDKTLRPHDPADAQDLASTVDFVRYALEFSRDR